jgi:hypothetical protein
MRKKEETWFNHKLAARFGCSFDELARGATCKEAALSETVVMGGFSESANLRSCESMELRLRFLGTPAGLGITDPRVVNRTL